MAAGPVYFVHPRSVEDFETTFVEVAGAGIRQAVLAARMGNLNLFDERDAAQARLVLRQSELESPAFHGLHSEHNDLTEAFNTEKWSYGDVYRRYCDLLGNS